MLSNPIASLYIHFPFCEARCHYCDFYSIGSDRTQSGDPARFEKALHQEAKLVLDSIAPELETVFLGGGTPSMTKANSIDQALRPLWQKTKITSNTEWTMEANPSSLSLPALRDYRQLGLNRISIGIQALQEEHLKLLGRIHSQKQALQALEWTLQADFDNVSVDLLCGIPNQTERELEETLEMLLQFPLSHLSCYLLTLPKHHRLYPQLPKEEEQLSHLLFVHHWMLNKGFEHYEISNFALPGKRARHNLNYWKGQSYLGLGPSAHSYQAQTRQRWKNFSSLHQYSRELEQGHRPIEWTESLSAEQMELEKWMLALRLDEGFPADWLKTPAQKELVKQLKTQGLLEAHPQTASQWRLTAKGFPLSEQIIRSFAC
jgi:oxygen-independent coproporphyrinogen-3 oxidase